MCGARLSRRDRPFFGIDSALSWLAGSEQYAELIAILKRCGISISRERMRWGEVAPAADTCNLQTKYTTVRDDYRRQGVPVLEMFHDAPVWAEKSEGNRFPQDQLAVARSWSEIGKSYSAGWAGLEIWNEPDLAAFAGEASPDQYLPMVKAINYSFRQAGITTPLGGGVFANPSPAFLRACAQNGLLDNVDFISFHNYSGVLDVEGQVAYFRDWLRENGKEALPLWITECGKSWKRGPQRPPLQEDARSALDITMKAIEARACGIARHFPFVFPFYEENTANFGMLGKECTPLRAMAAYAFAVHALAFQQFAGDLHCDDPAVRRARVFSNGKQALIVLYTGKPAPDATVKVAISPTSVLGIDGRPLKITTPGVIPIPDGLCYLTANLHDLGALLQTDCPAMRLTIAAHHAPPPSRGAPSPIIVSFRAQESGMATNSASPQGYWVSVAAAQQFPLHVRVSNLSTTAHQVTLHWQTAAADTRETPVDGPSLAVPPLGKVDVDWSVDLSALARSRGQHLLLISATSRKRSPPSPRSPFRSPPRWGWRRC